jgi:hypothetical protein
VPTAGFVKFAKLSGPAEVDKERYGWLTVCELYPTTLVNTSAVPSGAEYVKAITGPRQYGQDVMAAGIGNTKLEDEKPKLGWPR